MFPALREAASRVTARVSGSRFAKPLTRVVLAVAGLFLLAFIGKTAVAGAIGTAGPVAAGAPPLVPSVVVAAAIAPPEASAVLPSPLPLPVAAPGAPAPTHASPSAHTQATSDDPVILNTATVDDLRRLPGIGEKRATSIVALRTRLGGRFHVIEDLLKVKGIGRATLRRLRPLVRLDPPPIPADAGVATSPDEAPR
jgi:competence protein ComEA